MLDFFAIDDRPVVINRGAEIGWMWREGSWKGDADLADTIYAEGERLSETDFVHRFPYAALALLETTRD